MLIKINGTTVTPAPMSFKVDFQDIDSDESGRNQKGNMIRDRVAGGDNAKRKIECTWSGLSTAQARAILQAIKAVKFKVTYPDPYVPLTSADISAGREIHYREMDAYCGDRSLPVYCKRRIHNGANTTEKYVWENLTVNFIEY